MVPGAESKCLVKLLALLLISNAPKNGTLKCTLRKLDSARALICAHVHLCEVS